MIRVRFKTSEEDYRPVKWPVKHPYWCSGSGDGYWVLISYADDEDYILENWPEAFELDSSDENEYLFTERFPKPEWFTMPNAQDKAALAERPHLSAELGGKGE